MADWGGMGQGDMDGQLGLGQSVLARWWNLEVLCMARKCHCKILR